jgi:antitoxin ParD1/3/4
METKDQLRAISLERLRQEIREGLDSGPAKPWRVAELKREGRKLLSARTSSAGK